MQNPFPEAGFRLELTIIHQIKRYRADIWPHAPEIRPIATGTDPPPHLYPPIRHVPPCFERRVGNSRSGIQSQIEADTCIPNGIRCSIENRLTLNSDLPGSLYRVENPVSTSPWARPQRPLSFISQNRFYCPEFPHYRAAVTPRVAHHFERVLCPDPSTHHAPPRIKRLTGHSQFGIHPLIMAETRIPPGIRCSIENRLTFNSSLPGSPRRVENLVNTPPWAGPHFPLLYTG